MLVQGGHSAEPLAPGDPMRWRAPLEHVSGNATTQLEILAGGGPRHYRYTLLAPITRVAGLFPPMTGPVTTQSFPLYPEARRDLLWLTSFEATIVDPTAARQLSQEFNCHSNLISGLETHRRRFPSALHTGEIRLFTVNEGQSRVELPDGLAVPVGPAEELILQSQVLNLNVTDRVLELRHRIKIDFLRDTELPRERRPKPVVGRILQILKPLRAGTGGHAHAEQGAHAEEGNGSGAIPHAAAYRVGDGLFSGHWLLTPGREESRSDVTDQLALPFDTTLHHAAAHLHPFAVSIGLFDRTAGKPVFEASVREYRDRIGIESVDVLSSRDGVPLLRGHRYELVSVYENSSGEDSDAMAALFVYLRAVDLERALHIAEGVRGPTASGAIALGFIPPVTRSVAQVAAMSRNAILQRIQQHASIGGARNAVRLR